ncbi:MAG: DUF6282 family protein [Oscillospiraceae bacterium]|nr:DUF6282 family protein [Oscillospiraceae bacterium]
MDQMRHLIQGAYDLHIHSGPDLMPRKMDDAEMAERIVASGMAGFAMKSHYFCTGERAKIVSKQFPGCHGIGSLVLNQSVGGINPTAVEIAARSETKMIWFPTLDSVHGREDIYSGKPIEKLPYWARIILQMEAEGIEITPIRILDDNGKLIDPVYDVLNAIAKHNLTLVTGNISHEECFALVKAAHERKVEKIIIALVDHPSVNYSLEEQKELLQYGAYMEHCYNTWSSGKSDWEETLRQIKTIGPDRVVLTTDLGQKDGIYPDEGMLAFAVKLAEAGVSEADIRKMMVTNPSAFVK